MKIKFVFELSPFDEVIKNYARSKQIHDIEFLEFNDWSVLNQQDKSFEILVGVPTFFLKESFLKSANIKSMTVNEVQSADLAIYNLSTKQKSVYFFWQDCLHQVLQSNLKLSSGKDVAYITYTESLLKPLVNVMFKLGVSKFKVINFDDNIKVEIFEDIRRINFQIEIDLLPIDQMVGLSGDGILLVNTWSDTQYDEGLNSLAFFNFLAINSVIINFVDVSPDHIFKRDAKEEGIKSVDFSDLKLLQLDMIFKYVTQQFKI